jgi:3-(methylthio)propionyl---CoA ligase
MQQTPLLTSSLIEHAGYNHASTEVVSRSPDRTLVRSTWGEVAQRSRRVANMLRRLGVHSGERVATVAWNRTPHLELYFGVTGAGVVLHTVNPRLSAEQIQYILGHAESGLVFVDPDLLPIVEAIAQKLPRVRAYIVLARSTAIPTTRLSNLLCYEDLLAAESDAYRWPQLDENSASTLCYTSGTTGNPKGVLYSHRSTVLHAFCSVSADAMALSDPVWQERPLLLVRIVSGHSLDRDSMLTYLADKVAKWWLPDDVIFVEQLPHTATGKLLKTQLRQEYRDHLLRTAQHG